mmetsp:Transcript_11442/g.8384  ORF Transcript_11442/g.8384 Transcript_11442/m.8384 type:complete len:84 (+) Transcript_11442:203-454(+)
MLREAAEEFEKEQERKRDVFQDKQSKHHREEINNKVLDSRNKMQDIRDSKWDLKGKLIESYYKLDRLRDFQEQNPRSIDKSIV